MITQVLILTHRLSSIDRFTMEKLFSRESVLEHLGMVSLVSLTLAVELQARGASVDLGAVMTKAVVHDIDEVVTGDIARPTKYTNAASVRMFHELSGAAIEKVSGNLRAAGLKASAQVVKEEFVYAKSNDVEGSIVALADILAVVGKVREEVIIRGNRGMVRQAHTCRRQLVAYEKDRIAVHFSGQVATFLQCVTAEAAQIIDEAIAHDSPDLMSEVEEY